MKKLALAFVALPLLLVGCGTKEEKVEDIPQTLGEVENNKVEDTENNKEKGTTGNTGDTLDGMVTINIPATHHTFGNPEMTVEQYTELGVTDAVINDDDSVTLTLTPEQHDNLIRTQLEEVTSAIEEINKSKTLHVEVNDTQDTYTVTTPEDNPDDYYQEALFAHISLVFAPITMRVLQNQGELPDDHVIYKFVDKRTGKIYKEVTKGELLPPPTEEE